MRPLPLALAGTVVALVPAATASAQLPTEPRIAPGVSAGGVDVSNLTVGEASDKLLVYLEKKALRDVVLKTAGKTFRLDADEAKLEFDPLTSAKRALYAGRPAPGQTIDVPVKLTYSTLSIRDWARDVADEVERKPRNARLRIGLKKIRARGSRKGRELDAEGTERIVKEAYEGGLSQTRVLKQSVSSVKPKVTYKTLRKRHSTVLTVSKREFKIRLFKNFKVVKSYGVAIGQPAYPTPSGRYRIQNKQVNPVWSVPNSPWAGELAGTTVQGGTAQNPLKARWMGIVNGVGIHGTGQEWSIGTRASHGCIRMRVADVIALYKRVPVGTTIVIR